MLIWFKIRFEDEDRNELSEKAGSFVLKERKADQEERFEDKKRKLQTGDDLAPGYWKIVKVYVVNKETDLLG